MVFKHLFWKSSRFSIKLVRGFNDPNCKTYDKMNMISDSVNIILILPQELRLRKVYNWLRVLWAYAFFGRDYTDLNSNTLSKVTPRYVTPDINGEVLYNSAEVRDNDSNIGVYDGLAFGRVCLDSAIVQSDLEVLYNFLAIYSELLLVQSSGVRCTYHRHRCVTCCSSCKRRGRRSYKY
jgi:hypothetical protein